MPQDAFTLRHLCSEINLRLLGSKINKITQPNSDEIVLTVYDGKGVKKMSLNVNPARPRIGLFVDGKENNFSATPAFCMLLRKHLLGATITGVELVGFDRIVAVKLATSSEFSDSEEMILFVELMGRYSNVILTRCGKVLGAIRGINNFDDAVRPLIVNKDYVLPPVGDKKEPLDDALVSYFANCEGLLSEYIIRGVQGIAKDTAVEIENTFLDVYRDSLKGGNLIEFVRDNAKVFVVFLREFLYNPKANPCTVSVGGTISDVMVYPYQGAKGELNFFPTLIEAENYYHTERENAKRITAKRERISALINSLIKKAQKRVFAVSAKEKDAKKSEQYKLYGELILANAYQIESGTKLVVLQNYYDDYNEIEISLDEKLSPTENANAYYKKYAKAKRALEMLGEQSEYAKSELEYAKSLLEAYELCENEDDLDKILEELLEDKKQNEKGAKAKKKKPTGYRKYEIDGFIVKVGRNNIENDALVRESNSKDVWMHAKDYHSSHLIIETGGKQVGEKTIKTCAEICAYYSKARGGGKVEIAYTLKKHVKKPTGSKMGFCTYTDFKTVLVEGQKHAEFLKSE